MSNMVLLSISRSQGKNLLKLIDAFEVVFGSDTPIWLRGIGKQLRETLYPDSFR